MRDAQCGRVAWCRSHGLILFLLPLVLVFMSSGSGDGEAFLFLLLFGGSGTEDRAVFSFPFSCAGFGAALPLLLPLLRECPGIGEG